MNYYSIRHLTRFRYSEPISESIMETRMNPRSDSSQHCLSFSLSVSPRCRVFSYRDHLSNNALGKPTIFTMNSLITTVNGITIPNGDTVGVKGFWQLGQIGWVSIWFRSPRA